MGILIITIKACVHKQQHSFFMFKSTRPLMKYLLTNRSLDPLKLNNNKKRF